MQYEPHTPAWLVAARKQAGLTMPELADLAGVHFNTVQYAEKESHVTRQSVWTKLDAALFPIVPAFFVNEDALIADVRAYMHLKGEGALCRLYFVTGKIGIVFNDVQSLEEEELPGQHVVVTWNAALTLLEAQKGLLE